MTLHTIALASVTPQPWRNGGGSTRELLAWPTSAEWALRISVADVERDGPFSSYPGVDRWFAVLEGAGVTLSFAGGETWRVTSDEALLQFGGETTPHCTLIDGATRDLNVMAVRNRGNGVCEPADNGVARVAPATLRAIFAGDAMRLSRDGEPDVDLPPLTLAWSEQSRGERWCTHPSGRAWWIEFALRDAAA